MVIATMLDSSIGGAGASWRDSLVRMALFLHVHDAPGISAEDVRRAHQRDFSLGRDRGVDWVRYWVDTDAGKFFCLVEAPTAAAAEAVHAERHGMLAAEVYRVREGSRDRRDHEAMSVLFAGALAPDANCIDVGCHLGSVLRMMLRCAPDGRHIAYEPIPEIYTAVAARFPQVDVRQAALSSRSGQDTFVYLPERSGYSHLLREKEPEAEPSAERIVVRVETLDGTLPDDYVPTLVKIDVEGAGLEVLKGAEETLVTFRPIVLFEHGAIRRDDSEEIFQLLSERAGLRIYDIDGNGPMGRQRFLDVVGQLRVWNFVARP
jgi:FkbM family methyltransferase